MFPSPHTFQALFFIYFLVMQNARSFRTAIAWRSSCVRFLSSSNIDVPATTAIKPTWVLRFDGGSRGNPGLGGAGAAIYNYMTSGEMNEIWRGYFFVGKTGITNNQAEYAGLLHGLAQCKKMDIQSLCIQGDSELILRQVQGIYQVRNLHLIPLHRKALRLLSSIPVKTFQHIPRAQNHRADELSNMAMDRLSTMQAFSPEFAALLEEHSETNKPVATVDTAGLAPISKVVKKKSEAPAGITEVQVKKRRGRPPASETAAIRSMEQTVDVRTLPDPLPITVSSTTKTVEPAEEVPAAPVAPVAVSEPVEPAVEQTVAVVVKKTRARKVRVVTATEVVVPSVSETVTPMNPTKVVDVSQPEMGLTELIKKRTRTRKVSKENVEIVDGVVASK